MSHTIIKWPLTGLVMSNLSDRVITSFESSNFSRVMSDSMIRDLDK